MFHAFYFCVFFFKQKTAYEMRISDWSSDVCSSDLADQAVRREAADPEGGEQQPEVGLARGAAQRAESQHQRIDRGGLHRRRIRVGAIGDHVQARKSVV